MSDFFEKIISGIHELGNREIEYISGRNYLTLLSVDYESRVILARRGGDNIRIGFDDIEELAGEFSKRKLIDINSVFKAGGNVRSALEAIIAHLPNVGFYKKNTKFNKENHKRIFWFNYEIHSLGEKMDASDIEPIWKGGKVDTDTFLSLPKPFLLLAGISGTGKSRFIREQAKMVDPTLKNFLSIPVRPDWHEPSDLMGYVSRINGEEYVATDFLKFIVKAWRAVIVSVTQDGFQLKALAEIPTYWLCLDEMNLAPVEQYFADYLSVSETRCWEGETYTCDALLKPEVLAGLGEECRAKLAMSLGGNPPQENKLWAYFLAHGIALPPNLVVAGTVNMDETTHGFSRKVIDRAFTLDFGEFYPNDFDAFFEPTTRNKGLAFSRHSHASLSALAAIPADPNGAKSIAFFKAIHAVLQDTPFELAFRALNELLIAVMCYAPSSDATLQAVWDDYLMGKLLPRLDGDRDKLRPRQSNPNAGEEASLLSELAAVLQTQMLLVWDSTRVDLLREQRDDAASPILVACRSRKKIDWMQARLTNYGFTSFWP